MRVRSKRESPEMTRLPPADHRLKYPGKKNAKPQLSDVAMAKSVSSEDLWFIHGNGYDLNEFVERHPGGKEAILLGRGRDCTALAESYHPFSKQHRYVHLYIFVKYFCFRLTLCLSFPLSFHSLIGKYWKNTVRFETIATRLDLNRMNSMMKSKFVSRLHSKKRALIRLKTGVLQHGE